jgi:hypothetical protein
MSTKGESKNQRDWVEAAPLPGITANARWDLIEAQTNPRVKQELVVPIFVELLRETARSLNQLIEFLAKSTDQYSVPEHVMDRLQSEIEEQRDDGPILISLLSRADAVESRFWKVVSVGPPLARVFLREGAPCGKWQKVKTGRLSKTPVVGIIDDSIGFLHHRFRRSDGTTRFHRLWIMHNDTLAGNPGPHDPTPLSGVELTANHINQRLASNQSEMALYRQVNYGVFGAAIRHGTAFHAGHGTHVLDMAAGADPNDPTDHMSRVPILGVQLSPASIGETSGAALDPDLMRGFEWIITRALQMKGRFPLVINISLGSLAGPLDGTGDVERWIEAEMRRYHTFSGKAPIRVVIAYGNAHKARLVAEASLCAGEEVTLDWRILPDDATKSVLELRAEAGVGAQLAFALTPPDGGAALTAAQWPSGPTVHQYVVPSGVVCEVTNAVEVDPATLVPLRDKLLVTVAPTTRSDARPAAASGNWKVTVQNTGQTDATVSFKVQRDDTPGGYRRNGRQSWLDHSTGWGFEIELKAYSLPAAASPIRRENTEVSYAGFASPSVYFAGAARPDLTTTGAVRPSRYAAEGGMPMPNAPLVSAMGDDGSALIGRRAAGVLTGATVRMAGSSMAAPSVSRKLLEYAMTGNMLASLSGSHDAAELVFILGQAPAAVADARLGLGTVPA